VISTRTSPPDGSAAIQASNGRARCWPAASTVGSMRSRRVAERKRFRRRGLPALRPPRGRSPRRRLRPAKRLPRRDRRL
jgi:hypothetical protein